MYLKPLPQGFSRQLPFDSNAHSGVQKSERFSVMGETVHENRVYLKPSLYNSNWLAQARRSTTTLCANEERRVSKHKPVLGHVYIEYKHVIKAISISCPANPYPRTNPRTNLCHVTAGGPDDDRYRAMPIVLMVIEGSIAARMRDPKNTRWKSRRGFTLNA